jgi:hypothetical protein
MGKVVYIAGLPLNLELLACYRVLDTDSEACSLNACGVLSLARWASQRAMGNE